MEYELGSETWWGWHNSTAEEEDEMCLENVRTTNHLLPISISIGLSVAIGN